jgi:hypothetical protein
MKTYALVAAALAVALTAGCKDRDRDDTASRVDATADSAGAEARESANDVGDAVDTAADKAGDAAHDVGHEVADAARDVTNSWGWDRREEYRREARTRLDGLDRELADARKSVNRDATEAYTKAVAAARETRRHVGTELERLDAATESNWNELRDDFRASIDSLDQQLDELQPDAHPMGGAGPQ